MRLLPLIAAFALTGTALAAPPVPAPALKTSVVLGPKGLVLGTAKASFGQTRAAALKVVTAALGKPLEQDTYAECGQGEPMSYARYKGGVEIVFLHGKFSGWTVAEGSSATLRTIRGIAIGSTRAALKKAYPNVSVDPDTSLGVMFDIENDVAGFLDSKRATAKVVTLYAGETCMIS